MPTKLRVLSLLPSATEIVWALGLTDTLVGRSHECDFPSSIKKLPVVTSPAIDFSGSSADIDRAVKTQVHKGLSLFTLNKELIATLKPDIILTQAHCEVCAASEKDVERSLGSSLKSRPKIISLSPTHLDEVWQGIQEVADALGVSEKGREKVRLYRAKMETIFKRAERLEPKPTVAAIEWIDPLMAAGNWVPEIIRIAGGKNLFGEAGKHSPWMEYDDLLKKDPDIVLFLPCGFGIPRTRDELEPFTRKKDFFELTAIKNNRVFVVDGNQYFNRPGPRLVDSAEILAEIFHPDEFDFGRKNDGWEYWGFNRF